ncbi:MAG: methionine--tRNA ligase [Candidatus Taylorbacteria bacterium]
MSSLYPKKIYITTTLPYVNADPHVGFALEIVQADIVARFYKLMGSEVFFNTGTDEHGLKIWEKAKEEGKDPKAYVDEYAEKFRRLKKPLGLLEDIHFIRTTDEHHVKAAQEFWVRCREAGDIYMKNYKIKYCVGCELEKTESELSNGRCLIHPNLIIKIIDEENYFFKLSKYQDKLLALYDARKDFVVPDFRLNEIRSLIREKGLEDFSISRLKAKMPWGVPVPGDESQVEYVWFEAFVNYVSAIGWPDDFKKFNTWWPVIQFAGKDQVRQQAVMWQAMLMSAGLPPSKQIVIHGFITSGGQKMSKSLGNVISPFEIVEEYGTDALRYYLARHIHPFEDSDFTMEKFKEVYNANLANGIGNLASRIMKLAETHLDACPKIPENTIPKTWKDALESYDIKKAADIVWEEIGKIDSSIQNSRPFEVVKKDKEKGKEIISDLVVKLYKVAQMLTPILPETMEKIKSMVRENKMPEKPLFPRKE